MNKIRVNITVDKEKLEKAKTKLGLFGGKLSTLFNAYLSDFVSSMEKEPYEGRKELERKLHDMELRLKKLEDKK
jgi:predicted ribosome quality control (RQC) complex YloA/Tae2 family protein